MRIKTNTPQVAKAREGVMEFMLSNHPLDCPICDQGGECDLQDQAMVYGSDMSRFREWKRSTEDKNLGPLIKTIMTRCIHCTRCVRFAAEIAGTSELGATGRGNVMEIGTYIEKVFDSEVSGNVIDVCPVGALTSKPYAFTSRPWELRHVESIDVSDAVGANIRVDVKGKDIKRILPRLNEAINEEWLGDKGRFWYDGLSRQRLDFPMIRQGGDFVPVDWRQALEVIKQNLAGVQGHEMLAIAGDMADAESMVAVRDLFHRLGASNLQSRSDVYSGLSTDLRSEYVMNSGLAGVEQADALLLIGSNPRMEAPLFNIRVRKAVVHNGLQVGVVGANANLTYKTQHLGNDLAVLQQIADGRHAFCKVLARAQRPMIVVGAHALQGAQGAQIQAALDTIAQNTNVVSGAWNGMNVLHLTASKTGALDLGFTSQADRSQARFVYLLGADSFNADELHPDAFVVYQGHHGDVGALQADVILPGAAYTEKSGTYVNTEGRAQITRAATDAPAGAREDWKTVVALAEVLGTSLPYSTLSQVRSRLAQIAPHFGSIGEREAVSFTNAVSHPAQPLAHGELGKALNNYFVTDPISRSSKTMAKCAQTLKNATNSYL
jgi:NADH-quinone oxidoreductase chain G